MQFRTQQYNAMNVNLSYFRNHQMLFLSSILDVCKRNLKRIILVYLKINTIRNIFGLVIDHITVDVDVMVISVTKLDEPCLLEVPGHALPFRICQ